MSSLASKQSKQARAGTRRPTWWESRARAPRPGREALQQHLEAAFPTPLDAPLPVTVVEGASDSRAESQTGCAGARAHAHASSMAQSTTEQPESWTCKNHGRPATAAASTSKELRTNQKNNAESMALKRGAGLRPLRLERQTPAGQPTNTPPRAPASRAPATTAASTSSDDCAASLCLASCAPLASRRPCLSRRACATLAYARRRHCRCRRRRYHRPRHCGAHAHSG